MLCMQQLHDLKHTMHTHVQTITQHFIHNAITKLDNDQDGKHHNVQCNESESTNTAYTLY